eukprot:158751-Chlamydomonas_euryale.AAC.5
MPGFPSICAFARSPDNNLAAVQKRVIYDLRNYFFMKQADDANDETNSQAPQASGVSTLMYRMQKQDIGDEAESCQVTESRVDGTTRRYRARYPQNEETTTTSITEGEKTTTTIKTIKKF